MLWQDSLQEKPSRVSEFQQFCDFAKIPLKAGRLLIAITPSSVFSVVKLPFLFVLDAKVSKDDRSDIESSSDEEIYSNGSKNTTQTIKTKDGGHTGNLNGDTHEH